MSKKIMNESELRSLIRRVLAEQGGPEPWIRAPVGAPLGQIAFADQRSEVPRGREPNTAAEARLFDELYEFIGANVDMSPEAVATIVSSLESGHYDDVFFYSRAPVHYRMMELSGAQLQRLLDVSQDELPDEPMSTLPTRKTFASQKTSGLSSWTRDKRVAQEMVDEALDEGADWCVILVAPSSENPRKFLDVKKIYDVLESREAWQRECIALGPVQMSEIWTFKSRD